MTLRNYISVFLFLLLFASCFTSRDLSSTNMASFYKPSDNIYHPEIAVWNQMDSSVKVIVKLSPDELLFVRQPDESFKSYLKIITEVIRSYDDTKILDSVSTIFSFDIQDKAVQKTLSFNLPTKQTGNLLLRVILYDLNKGSFEDFFTPLEINNNISRNDFLITNKKNQVLFKNYFGINDSVIISYKDSSINKMWCKYYNRQFLLPASPFSFDMKSDFDYRPDSIFQISVNESLPLLFSNKGFYHFQIDTLIKQGGTIFRFDSGFPNVSTSAQLLEPLQYITSKKEFEELQKSTNLKAAIELFWLSRGGNEEKTRALIRKYYGRVQDANRYFTSFTEGWKTDRGMLYIIFGAPSTLYLSGESETWIYGTPNSTLALSFFFTKVINPFTANDFVLSRTPIYESNWYRAVETWRQGRAFNSFN